MKNYESPMPRALFGVVAIALTALTIALAAVLPVATGPSARVQEIALASPPSQAAGGSSPAQAVVRYIEPIEVVAVRPPVISAQERELPAKHKEQG